MIFNDKNIISKIFNHPNIFNWISDDLSAKPYIPDIRRNLYIMDDLGNAIVKVSPVNGVCCHVHIAVLPEMMGEAAITFFKQAITWGFQNTQYMKIIGMIPEYNKLAINLAKRIGFEQEGIIKKSFLKNHKLHDQVLLGLTKVQFYCKGA